jgi:hypothetical protein
MVQSIDQNGAVRFHSHAAGRAFQVGAPILTSNEALDFIFLHELAHSFGKSHGDNDTDFNKDIWSWCFR